MIDDENETPVSRSVIRSVNEWVSDIEENDAGMRSTLRDYHAYILRKWIFMAVCIFLAFLISGVALTIGGYDIGFSETYSIIWGHLTGVIADTVKDYVIINMRSPRVLIGIISGCGLAVAGVVMQSILKNPLADPYTTGVSAGALFGATVAITTQMSYTGGPYTIVMNAFIFSLVPTMVIVGVAKKRNASPTVMIMAGIAVMYIFNAMTTVMKLWSDPNSLADLYRWQVGSLTMATWDDLPIVFAVVIAGVVFTMLISKKLNVMSTGDESAKALGVNVETMRIACLVAVALMSAVIVSFTGLIGFVGLIAPHVARIFIGADNRYLIPASALFGATLMLASDLIGRTIIAPATLQVGVVTAFLGGPLFLWLIINRKNKVWG